MVQRHSLRPNFLTAAAKKDGKNFEWNYKNFSDTLKKELTEKVSDLFEKLAYSCNNTLVELLVR